MRARLGDALEWAFSLLLRLYPPAFREEYGRDERELLRDGMRDAAVGSGVLAMLGVWASAMGRSLVGVVREHRAAAQGGRASGEALRSAFRSLVRSPAHAGTVVATLGLGIGANVALFSLINGVILAPLPYPEPDQLVRIWATNPDVDQDRHGPSPLDFADWMREATAFESLASWYVTSGTYRTESWVEELPSAQVTADFFRVMGVRPLLGRDFRPDEVVEYGPIMLSHRLWVRRFGADPAIIGQMLTSGPRSFEIVGVMPPDFNFPNASVEAWVAWDLPTVYADRPDARGWRFLGGIGRLGSGVSAGTAQQDLAGISGDLAIAWPTLNRGWSAQVTPLRDQVIGNARGILGVAFGATLFILLIACANVASLMLARVPARSRDLGIRTALGASRADVARTLVAEGLLIAASGGVLGLVLGKLMLEGLITLGGAQIPRLDEVGINGGVLVFALLVSLVTSLATGLVPAVQTLRGAAVRSLAGGGRTIGGPGHRRVRELFVSSQVTVAVVLLTGAGLFSTSLKRVLAVDPGFDPAGVASFRVSLDRLDGGPAAVDQYYQTLLDRIEAIPGVVAVGGTQALPLSLVPNDFQRPYRELGASTPSSEASTVQMRIVTPGYTETMRMPLRSGTRLPLSAVFDEPMVAIINETLAGRLWPEGDAVGQALEVDFLQGWRPYTVVGVVQDVKHRGLRSESQAEIYLSHRQTPYAAMSLVARTTGDPTALFPALEEVVVTHLPMQPAHNFASLESLLRQGTAEERFLSWLLQAFSAVALLLATTGVYGVVALSVSQRRREIGVRMALGAEPGGLVLGVLLGAGRLAAAGLAVGAICVFLLGKIVEGLLFGVPGFDPLIAAQMGALLFLISLAAAWIAGRHAARVPPTEALRPE